MRGLKQIVIFSPLNVFGLKLRSIWHWASKFSWQPWYCQLSCDWL